MKKGMMVAAICLLGTALAAQARPPFHAWTGLHIGALSAGSSAEGTLLSLNLDLSAQLGRRFYASLYFTGGSVFLGDNDAVDELGVVAGPCLRTRRVFAGAAAGLGRLNGWLDGGPLEREIGVPVRLEGALILSRFVALAARLQVFLARHSYGGISLGIQLGKLR